MQNRSWLLVPGDSDRKLGKAMATGADFVVVDLADSVPVVAKNDARRMAVDWLNAHRRQILESKRLGRWVRINPIDSRQWREDLMAVVQAAPDGIVLPSASGTEAVRQLAAELYELEQANQVPSGSIKIMPVLGASPHSACSILSFADIALPRLAGITWDADKLALAIGATRQHHAQGWTAALGLVRAQALLVAHANGVPAVEACCADAEDAQALKALVQDARADGFTGMFATHPAQVAEINAVFTPTAEEIDQARRIVAVFEANGELGELQIDRRTIGKAQLQQARRMLNLEVAPEQSPARFPILRTA